MIVLVVGIKGVGKSTVLERIGWKILNFGDYMMEILREKNITRDELQWKLNLREYKKIQKEAGERLIKDLKNFENIFIDSHAVIKTSFGWIPGFPLEILEKMPLDLVLMIYAKPEEIFQRLLRDYYEKGRKRKIHSIEELKEWQEIEEKYAIIISEIKWVPFEKIENKEGKIEETVERVKRILERI